MVQQGATLTVDAGVTIEFGNSAVLDVAGTLQTEGSITSTVVLTNSASSSVWSGVLVASGGTLSLAYTTMANISGLSNGAVDLEGGSASLDHVTITASHTDGIYVATASASLSLTNSTIANSAHSAVSSAGAAVTIHYSNFINDGFGMSNCAGCTLVHAENNYWGTPTGPAPYGTGPGISYHTQYDPNNWANDENTGCSGGMLDRRSSVLRPTQRSRRQCRLRWQCRCQPLDQS
jgi:hypothetical protein